MKVGLIRCQKTADMCSSSMDFKVMKEKKGAFKDIKEEIEVTGVNSCGGCPGEKAAARAAEMVKRGADTIVLTTCITKMSPLGSPCPNAEKMIAEIEKKVGESIRIIDHTHFC
jgi:predicted metal-binding protein